MCIGDDRGTLSKLYCYIGFQSPVQFRSFAFHGNDWNHDRSQKQGFFVN